MNEPCQERSRPTMYKMKMVFSIDISLKAMNEMTQRIDGGRFVAANAMQITLQQTVPFIPNKEQITQYEQILFNGLKENQAIQPEKVTFHHYDYIYQIEEGEQDPS